MPQQIRLRTATEDDIPNIETWARAIDAGQFMSRYLQDRSQTVLWKIIIVDSVETGTTSLEKAGLPMTGCPHQVLIKKEKPAHASLSDRILMYSGSEANAGEISLQVNSDGGPK
jgi:hypothetical protein